MNTKSRFFAMAVLVLLAIVSLFAVRNTQFPIVEAEQSNAPWLVGMDKDAHRTGPVSKTCIDRTLFQYHNLDKGFCGDPVALPTSFATKVARIIKVIVTLTKTPDVPTTTTKTPVPTTITPATPTITATLPTDTSTLTPPPTGTPEPTIVPTDLPTEEPTQIATEPAKTKKPPCNNGNGEGSDGDHTDGDGAEGCNASDNGNNDETKEKGDKVKDATVTPASTVTATPAPAAQ